MELTVEKLITQTEPVKLDIIEATLPSVEEVELFPKELIEHRNWWWLRSPGGDSCWSAYVSYSGYINYHGFVISTGGDVRPMLRLTNLKDTNLKVGDKFIFKNKTFQIVSEDIAFCLDDIGTSCFNKKYRKKDANDYEKSDIKKYIERWFNTHD